MDGVDLVIHADPPTEHKAYTHRSGRTARGGAEGTVVTIQTVEQSAEVRSLMRKAGVSPQTTAAGPGSPVLRSIAGPAAKPVIRVARPASTASVATSAGGQPPSVVPPPRRRRSVAAAGVADAVISRAACLGEGPSWRRDEGTFIMEYRQLGHSGLRVSTLTLGTMTFGGRGGFSAVGTTGVTVLAARLTSAWTLG